MIQHRQGLSIIDIICNWCHTDVHSMIHKILILAGIRCFNGQVGKKKKTITQRVIA